MNSNQNKLREPHLATLLSNCQKPERESSSDSSCLRDPEQPQQHIYHQKARRSECQKKDYQPKKKVKKVKLLSHVRLFATPWTVAHQAPLSMEFSRQEYWSGLSFAFPGNLPNPGIKPTSLASPVLSDGFFTTVPPGKPGKPGKPQGSYKNPN